MGHAEEITPDIAILLAQTWRTRISESIDRESICRIWAFDFGWFDMETASRVRDNLIQTGWLDVSGESLQSGIDIGGVDVPFGWLPTMRILDAPPTLPKGESVTEVENVELVRESIQSTVERAPIDPAVTHITILLEQIADASGLDRKEVMRRAQRKRRALGPVTLWMALLLVAREQQLPMHGFVRMITT